MEEGEDRVAPHHARTCIAHHRAHVFPLDEAREMANLPPATVTAYSTGCKTNGHAELWTQQGGVHIPKLSPTFGDQVVAYLMAHPKP